MISIMNLAAAHHVSAMENQMCRQRLDKALKLYELAHQLQMREDISSPRASIIIANNVGEIHRAVGNCSKHTLCLQHLLSTMMHYFFFPDACKVPMSSIELDGFFRNILPLILHNNCAGAA